MLRILVVEDDEDDFFLLQEHLGSPKFSLERARSCEEGRRRLAEGNYDVALVDYALGACCGLDLIREHRSELPMLLLTGQGNDQIDEEALEAGAWDYLVKGEFTPALLQRAVRYAVERHRAKSSLRQMAQIVESSYNAVVSYQPDGIILSWNRGAERTYGYTAQEMIGESIARILPPTHRAAPIEEGRDLQGPRVRKDGKVLDMLLTISPMTSGRGDLIAYAEVGKDTTGKKEAERLYRDLFENASDIIYTLDLQGVLTSLNKTGFETLGFDPDELIGRPIAEMVLPGYHRLMLDNLAIKMAGAERTRYEARVTTKSGRILDLEVSSRLIFEGEKPVGIQGIARDVTDKKSSEVRFRALFEHTLDAVLICDDAGFYIDANPAACKLVRQSREEIVGRHIRDFSSPAERGRADELWETFLSRGEMKGIYQMLRSDGVLIDVDFAAKANVLPGIHLSVLRDLSERKSLEEQLRQSQKMEAIGRLAGGIAHDFNNLLTAIGGYADLALLQTSAIDPVYECLQEIKSASTRASALTAQLLAFSRKQIVQPKMVDLNGLVTELRKLMARLIGSDIDLQVTLEPELPLVKIDPVQMEQVVVNLVVNARDAMPDGGTLRLATRRCPEGVLLEVRDTGVGMSPEVLERIFEPFYTTKPLGEGTGLGLSTAYGIVRQAEGTISVESSPGEGTAFRIALPAAVLAEAGQSPKIRV